MCHFYNLDVSIKEKTQALIEEHAKDGGSEYIGIMCIRLYKISFKIYAPLFTILKYIKYYYNQNSQITSSSQAQIIKSNETLSLI